MSSQTLYEPGAVVPGTLVADRFETPHVDVARILSVDDGSVTLEWRRPTRRKQDVFLIASVRESFIVVTGLFCEQCLLGDRRLHECGRCRRQICGDCGPECSRGICGECSQ